jgi:hypothetical protein
MTVHGSVKFQVQTAPFNGTASALLTRVNRIYADLERVQGRAQPSRRGAEHVLEAQRELAHQIARDGGADTAAVEQARAAVGRARAA